MKLFPQEKATKYLTSHSLPELLSPSLLRIHSTSPESLLKHCQSLLELLELNKVFHKYELEGAAFQSLFEQFELHYKNRSHSPEAQDYRFDLIKVEQVLYLVTGISATQDVSSYLHLVEETCDNERILELVHLLYRKHDIWTDGYSEGYVKWMHFLAPFMSYMANIKFDFHIASKLDESIVKENVSKVFKELKTQLENRKIEVLLQDVEFSDAQRSVTELMKLRSSFSGEMSSSKDNQFYYELGQWSLLVHLLNVNERNDLFSKICLWTIPYFDVALKLAEVPEAKGVIKSLENVSSIQMNQVWKQDFVQNLFSEFAKKNSTQAFECLLSSMLAKKNDDSALFLTPNQDSEPLILRILNTVLAHREDLENLKSPYYGIFLNEYEYFMWVLFSILESINNKSPKDQKTYATIIQTIRTIVKETKLRSFVKAKAYDLLILLSNDDAELGKSIVTNWNLSETPLKNIIDGEGPKDPMDLFLNLRYSIKFFNLKAADATVVNNISHSDFSDNFRKYISKITGEITVPEHTVSLKHIGTFLLELLSLKISKLRKIKLQFLNAVLEFLVQKCQLDVWDGFSVQDNLFNIIGASLFFKPVLQNTAMNGLFKILEAQIQATHIQASTLELESQLLRSNDGKKVIYDMLVSSLETTQDRLDSLWKSINWEKRDSPEEEQKVLEISRQCTRFTYYSLKWALNLLLSLKPKKDTEDCNKLSVLSEKIAVLYFHPAFSLGNEVDQENSIQGDLKTLVGYSNHIDLRCCTSFYKALENRLTCVNEEILAVPDLKKTLLKDIKLIISRESSSKSTSQTRTAYYECTLKQSIEVHILSKSLLNIKEVFSNDATFGSLAAEEKRALSKNFETALAALGTFISRVTTLFDFANLENEDPSHYTNKPLAFMDTLGNACKGIMKPFYGKAKGEEAKLVFFSNLMKNSFSNTVEYSSELVIDIVMTLIEGLETNVKARVIPIILCQPKVWSVFLRRISDVLKQKITLNTKGQISLSNQIDIIKPLITFISSLLASFKTDADINNVKTLLGTYKFEISPDQFMTQLFLTLADELEKFPFQYILCQNDPTISQVILPILQLFEKTYIHHKQANIPKIKKLEDSMKRIEEFLKKDTAAATATAKSESQSTGIKSKISKEESLSASKNLKEALDSQAKVLTGKLDKAKEEMNKIAEADAPFDDRFFSKVDVFAIVSPFDTLKSLMPEKFNAVKKDAFNNLANFLHNYSLHIMEKTGFSVPEELKEVKQKEVRKDREFLEIEVAQNSSANQLLTVQNYLQLMINLLTQASIAVVFEETLIWQLFHTTTILLNQLLNQTEEQNTALKGEMVKNTDISVRICVVIDQLLKVLCTYFNTKYLQDKLAKTDPQALYDWFKLMTSAQEYFHRSFGVNILTQEGSSFKNLMSLVQIILYQEPDLALANDCELIHKLFSIQTKEALKISTVSMLAFVIDILFEGYLPKEMVIENKLKGLLLASSPDYVTPYKLSSIASDPVLSEYEKKSMKTIVSVLLKKFKVTSLAQDAKIETRFAEANLAFTFDLTKEDKAPNAKIQETLSNLSVYARSVIDHLLLSLVDNHLYNLAQLSEIKEQRLVSSVKFRDTTGLAALISILLGKYTQLLVYLVFEKRDFKSSVKQHVSKIPFLTDLDLESLQSTTFLNCLFKIKYFAYNVHDFVLILKPALYSTGITFINSEDPESVVDISRLILNELVNNMSKELEIRNKKPAKTPLEYMEAYLTLYASVAAFGFILNNIRNRDLQDKFGRHTRKAFAELQNQTLYALKDLPRELYDPLKNYGSIENFVFKNTQHYYNTLLNIISLSKEAVDQLKQESYKDFLSLENTIQVEPLVYSLETIRSEIEAVPKEQSHRIVPKTDAGYRSSRVLRGLNKDTNLNMVVPVSKNSSMCAGEAWATILGKAIQNINNVGTLYSRAVAKQGQEESKEQSDIVNALRNFAFYLEATKFDLGSEGQIKPIAPDFLSIKSTPLLDINTCLQKKPAAVKEKFSANLSKRLIGEAVKEESKQAEKSTVPGGQEGVTQEVKPSPSDVPPVEESKTEEIVNDSRIRYFVHPSIKQQSDFELVRRQMMVKLKIISEQVSLSLSSFEFHKEAFEAFKKEVVNNELSNHIGSLPTFERSMLLCLISRFELLKSFDYPPNFQEIKEELSWIEANFAEYIKILSTIVKPADTEIQVSKPLAIDPDHQELLFPEDFRFCTDYTRQATGVLQPENAVAKTTFQKSSYLLREMFPIDDLAVESVISLLYINYEKKISGANGNPLQLINELCNSPSFEAKFMDFCLFFLYSPDHLEIISMSFPSFPYPTLFNSQKPPELIGVYNVVAFNILDILRNLFSVREYLLHQPRTYFDQYGLKSLLDLKQITTFYIQTAGMVSVCDLLLGLLDVKAIMYQPQLLSDLEALIIGVFSKPRQFNVLKVNEGDEFTVEKPRVFTRKSIPRLLGMNNIEPLYKNLLGIIVYDFDTVIYRIEASIEILNFAVEEVNHNLKSKIRGQIKAFNEKDIESLVDFENVLINLKEALSLASFVMSEWESKKLQNPAMRGNDEERDQIYNEVLQNLKFRVLHEKIVEEFFMRMFELADYLSEKEVAQIPRANILSTHITKICINYYTLACIQENSVHRLTLPRGNTSELPVLSSVVSHEPIEEVKDIPQLTSTFSDLRRTQQFDLDLLFANMCRKYQDFIVKLVLEDKNKKGAMQEISIICKKLPWILNLTTKKKILGEAIDKDLQESGSGTSTRSISVNRKDLVRSLMMEFSNKPLKVLKKKVQVSFANEAGYDAGGLRREFMTISTQALFEPERGLFELSGNRISVQPSPAARLIPSHLRYLELAGIMLAKAIQEQCVVDINLTKPMLKHILNHQLTINDLEDLDSELAKSLRWILENPVEGLHHVFTYEIEVFGQKITKELVHGGYHIEVTEENKREFVTRMCEVKMKEEIKEELEAFLRGFYLIIPPEFLSLFSPSELQLLIAGIPTIDIEELKKYAQYIGYDSSSDIMKWLWEIFSEFSQKELAAFVFFTSGSVKLPSGWFKEKQIRYKRAGYGANHLPIAHTCSWEIEIPPYKSKEELRQKLMMAIFEGQGSFGMN